ncbi:LysR family transcriptional regulator [Ferrimonas balearica]|uniref:LysR family transcriptional regulator n=1 Tax=Ferrimonas balearica TaxID=44012 RepID=UPI001C582D5E|nr:LysR family transcriptional regulator [Ferrimonas balearica]MBW3164184.1 LysR family transcriptional regulator [Ferrimonas balearica]
MDIRKLEIFAAVAHLGSITAASRQLHMAQPAVSIAIQKLEHQLGCTLLYRDRKGVRLTGEGQLALAQAERVLAEMGQFNNLMSQAKALMTGTLTLTCPAMLANYVLPELLTPFLAAHPGLTASVQQAGTGAIAEGLNSGEIELGVISGPPTPEWDSLTLLHTDMVLLAPEQHPLARQSAVSVNALHGQPMVVYQREYHLRQRLERLCRSHQVSPDIKLETNFLPLIARMVREGVGLGVGLASMATQEPGIKGVSLLEETPFSLSLAWLSRRPLSRANQAFVQYLSQTQASA